MGTAEIDRVPILSRSCFRNRSAVEEDLSSDAEAPFLLSLMWEPKAPTLR